VWTLQIVLGRSESGRHDLGVGSELVIGRDPTADIIVPERSVSRRHCRVIGTPMGVEVHDLNSANGVWIGGKQVTSATLGSGSEMQVGPARIRVIRRDGQTGMVPIVSLSDSQTADRSPATAAASESTNIRLDPRQTAYKSLEKDRLALLIEAGKSLTGALEVEEVLARIMNHLFEILPVKRAAIALLEPGGTLKARLVRPESEHHELSGAFSHHIIQKVLDSRMPAIIDDAAADDALNRAQSIVQANIRAAICAPLSAQSRVLGALYADYPGRARLYRQSDLDFFGAFAGIAAVALENARLQEDARERAKLQRDLEIAGEIQLGLLPDDSFAHPGVEIDWTYRPSKQIGGDFYDCMPLGGDKLAMVLGDVSGKSVAAALFMARTMSFLRSLIREDSSPAAVLAECNKLLGIRIDRVMFATSCYLLLNPVKREARFASAGHNPVLVYDPATDSFAELGATGPPLGITPDAVYTECRVELAPSSVIVLYTDGIVEARNKAGAFFGLPLLKEIVRQHAKGSPHDVTAALLSAVEAHWMESTYIRDDFALLIAKLAG
jgi:sigma-B regulation protein RsbU (phosphoserine phosphatase)